MHFRPYIRVTAQHDTLYSAEMWALTVSFLTLWMGLFFFQEAVRVDKPLMMFLTVLLMLMNITYVLIAFRWFLIIKLVDLETQEDVRRRCTDIHVHVFYTLTQRHLFSLSISLHPQLLHREGMERGHNEISAIMQRWLIKIVPEWYHMQQLEDQNFKAVVCNFCYLTQPR
jgi:hypothetical protein